MNSHSCILPMQASPPTIDSLEITLCSGSRHAANRLNLIMCFLTFASMACIVLFVASNYIKQALVTLEQSHSLLTFLTFLILFIFVSLPMTWGYVLLNLAAGYLYGIILGMAIVFFCAMVGVTVSHFLIRHSLKRCIISHVSNNNSLRSIISVVESRHGFKVVALARLTPIPFGLQNSLFGVGRHFERELFTNVSPLRLNVLPTCIRQLCRISLYRYLCASTVGMLPTQGLHTYIGSTLRSMEDVISSNHGSKLARVIFASQFLLVGALLIFILKKARSEFKKTLCEADDASRRITLV